MFEALNLELGEAVIGISDHCSLEALIAEHRKYPPVWMAKWNGKADYRWAARELPRADAVAFARNYAVSGGLEKLKVYVIV